MAVVSQIAICLTLALAGCSSQALEPVSEDAICALTIQYADGTRYGADCETEAP